MKLETRTTENSLSRKLKKREEPNAKANLNVVLSLRIIVIYRRLAVSRRINTFRSIFQTCELLREKYQAFPTKEMVNSNQKIADIKLSGTSI